MMPMKELLWALGLAWGVMAMVGCTSGHATTSSRTLLGDRSSAQYVERAGVVQNLNTGELSRRVGPNYIQNLSTGELQFTYGGFVEEPRR